MVFSCTRAGGGQFASSSFKIQGSTSANTDNGRQMDKRSSIGVSTSTFFGAYIFKAGEYVTIVNLSVNNMTLIAIYLVERDATS